MAPGLFLSPVRLRGTHYRPDRLRYPTLSSNRIRGYYLKGNHLRVI